MKIMNVCILLVMLAVLSGCGSSSNGGDSSPAPDINKLTVNCLEMSNDPNRECGGLNASGIGVGLMNVDGWDYVWNSGTLNASEIAYGLMNVANDGISNISGFYVVPQFINGCGGNGYITGSWSLDASENGEFRWGDGWCNNAMMGDQQYEIHIYNGLPPIAPTWNDMWTTPIDYTWDWGIVNTDIGTEPLVKAKVMYEFQ